MGGARKYTYAKLAEWAGVTRCRGINPRNGATCFEDHDKGSWADGMVHWGERERVTKLGIRRFLYLAAQSNVVVANSDEGWPRIYLSNQWVNAAANALMIRIPANLANHDRARVRAMIAGLPVKTPMRPEALQWSQRERQARTTPPARAGAGADLPD